MAKPVPKIPVFNQSILFNWMEPALSVRDTHIQMMRCENAYLTHVSLSLKFWALVASAKPVMSSSVQMRRVELVFKTLAINLHKSMIRLEIVKTVLNFSMLMTCKRNVFKKFVKLRPSTLPKMASVLLVRIISTQMPRISNVYRKPVIQWPKSMTSEVNVKFVVNLLIQTWNKPGAFLKRVTIKRMRSF